mgnify:CR=1 FL=1
MAKARVLNESEIKRVLAVIACGRNSPRNRVAFLLSVLGGLRVGEIAKLRVGDILTPDGCILREVWLSKEQTKGSKGRQIYINDKLANELALYMKLIKSHTLDQPLLPSQRAGRHFSNTTLCMLFASIFKQAGIKASSHSGRRTFATRLNELGVGMRTIQKLMGHQHIATTAIYCDVSDDVLHRAVNLVG